MQFHRVWIDQCEAAEGIAEKFGRDDAITYLIGEKFMNFVEAAGAHPEFAKELPEFAARIQEIFSKDEIRDFLAAMEIAQAQGDEDLDVETLEEAGDQPDDVVRGASEILLLERAKELLLL